MLTQEAFQSDLQAAIRASDDVRKRTLRMVLTAIKLAEIENKYNGNGDSLTEGGMVRVASYTVLSYWREIMRLPRITSLNDTVSDEDGDEVELCQLLADDKAIDVEAWLDARRWLFRAPSRLIKVAYKKVRGLALSDRERNYLYHHRKKSQKALAFI